VHNTKNNKAAHPKGAPFRHSDDRLEYSEKNTSGNILMYVFIAVGLLAALTVAIVKDGTVRDPVQEARRAADVLIQQSNYLRTAFQECAMLYPDGGGDLDGDGDVDNNDNPYAPFPLEATDSKQPNGAGASQYLIDQQCTGAPAATAYMFRPPSRYNVPDPQITSQWFYEAGSAGLRLEVSYSFPDQIRDNVVDILDQRLADCEFSTYDTGSTRFMRFWLRREGCS